MDVHLALALVLAVVGFGTTACGDATEAAQAPSRPADVRGTVTAVERPQDGRTTIVVDRGAACALVVYVDAEAEVLRASGDGEIEASADELMPGQTVDAWVGAIAESCPEQTQAERVVIAERAG